MIIFASGEIHGKIKNFYSKVLEVEKAINKPCDWVLQSGDFGIFPDKVREDRQTKNNGNSDFSELYTAQKRMPRQTLFISGKHEDHSWLELKNFKGELELLSNLHWLVNGYKTHIGDNSTQLSVCGLGKVFSPHTYLNGHINKKSKSHYTRDEIEAACTQGPIDIFLSHQAGHGEKIGNFVSNSEGLNKICYATRPKLHIHSGYNISDEYINRQGVLTISLSFFEIKVIEWENNQFRILGKF